MKYISTTFLVLTTCYVVCAQVGAAKFSIQPDLTQIPLWNGAVPNGPDPQPAEKITDAGSVTQVSNPRLLVHRPAKANGTAILVISGGGYAHIELGKESTPTANWLQSEGVTVFELVYRLPAEGWKTSTVPFQDAQRAMRIIRDQASIYQLDTTKIGILGFSAGGHLAGFTAAQPNKIWNAPADKIDLLSAKPNFVALIYPVLSMLPPNDKTHARKSILGQNPTLAQERSFSVEQQVTDQMPEVFLAQAADDPISPIANSFLMDSALKKLNIPVELHVFQTGGHGWGLGKPGTPVAAWPILFKNWAQHNGFWLN